MDTFFSQLGYLQWFCIGLLLILLELVVPGVYLIWFGFSAFCIGAAVWLVPLSLMEQLVWFALSSAVFAGLGFVCYRRLMHGRKVPEAYKNLNNPAAEYVGKVYNLAGNTQNCRGKVSIGDSLWLVECDTELKKGDRVIITAIKDGVVLTGKKA